MHINLKFPQNVLRLSLILLTVARASNNNRPANFLKCDTTLYLRKFILLQTQKYGFNYIFIGLPSNILTFGTISPHYFSLSLLNFLYIVWIVQYCMYMSYNVSVCISVYHLGRLVDFTTGAIPSLYKLLVLLKFTMLKITL